MSDLFVTLTAQWSDGNAHYPSGNYEIFATGALQDSGYVGLVVPVILGQLDQQGSFSGLGINTPSSLHSSTAAPNSGISVLASDSFTTGYLVYNFKIEIAGIAQIRANGVPINFASGATQSLFTVLSAAGYTPPASAAFWGGI